MRKALRPVVVMFCFVGMVAGLLWYASALHSNGANAGPSGREIVAQSQNETAARPDVAPDISPGVQAQIDGLGNKVSKVECEKNFTCWSERNLVDAEVDCQSQIERKAPHEVKWTDGLLGSMFSLSAWGDDAHRTIRYAGDQVEFQNDF